MWRVLAVGLVAVLVGHVSQSAQASTITYDLTLSNTSGPTNGNGTFTVNGPVNNGTDNFTSNTNGGLDSLSIWINGEDFTLANALTTSSVTFNNGVLTNVSYLGEQDNFKLDLLTDGLYYLYVDANNWSLSSTGTISAFAAPSVAPLPTTSVLFATGLLGFAFLMYRRRSSAHLSSASPAVA